jgi:anti-anti-sigma factor
MPPVLHPPPATFSCHRRHDGTVICRVAGQIDMDARTAIRAAFRLALDLTAAQATLIVDLAGMHFCDSTGLNALLQLRADAQAQHARLLLSDAGPQFSRLLQASGADTLFSVHPTLTAAVRAAHPAPGSLGPTTRP